MDWATFFKDYGQSLFTLGGVLVGSLITFLVNWLNVRTQSIERDKDRLEARIQSKIQIALDILSRDIKIIEDAINSTLNEVDTIAQLNLSLLLDRLSDEEIREKLMKEWYSVDGKYAKLEQSILIADKIAYTFGDEFHSLFKEFCQLAGEHTDLFFQFDRALFSHEEYLELTKKITKVAGELHIMMNRKLISIRATEL